jgi:glycosyltransferase involved in cell wall biosynthesis
MNIGGTARYVAELVDKIPNNKLATGYVQGSEVEDPCIQKFDVIRVAHLGRKIAPINDIRAWCELRRVIRTLQPTIVHTHTFKAGLIGRMVPGGHKRVHTFHGHLFDDQSFSTRAKKVITFVEKLLARRTNLLISVGKKVGIELQAERIGLNGNWLSIPPGVQPLPLIEAVQARKILGLRSEGVLFGWMARMAQVKNPFLMLEIAKLVPGVNFVMAGGGDLLSEIQNRAPNNVAVIGWSDASTFWSAVDCAISTSDNEGMPIALIEAQLAGIPVIATDVGSNAEVVINGSTGIVTSSQPAKLAEAVKTMLSERELLITMGEAAKNHANKEFNLHKMIDSHVQAYLSLTVESSKRKKSE